MQNETALVFVAAMTRVVLSGSRIMDWMGCRCAISRRDRLRASHVHRRLAGYLGAKTESASAVMALIVGHRTERMALGMIAGSAAWSPGHSGSGNNHNTHGFILAVSSAAIRNTPTSPSATLELLTICSKTDTYC